MIASDDFHLETRGPECRPLLVVFFVLCRSLRGSALLEQKQLEVMVLWVGFELLQKFTSTGNLREES